MAILQGIDSMVGLQSVLDTQEYRFKGEKQRYDAIHKVLDPVSKCVSQLVDIISDAVESVSCSPSTHTHIFISPKQHLSHSKVIFGAIRLLFKVRLHLPEILANAYPLHVGSKGGWRRIRLCSQTVYHAIRLPRMSGTVYEGGVFSHHEDDPDANLVPAAGSIGSFNKGYQAESHQ